MKYNTKNVDIFLKHTKISYTNSAQKSLQLIKCRKKRSKQVYAYYQWQALMTRFLKYISSSSRHITLCYRR